MKADSTTTWRWSFRCRCTPLSVAGGGIQSEYIAEGIAAQLGVEVDRRSVRRVRNTASQALKPRRERAGNVEDAFAVRRPERLAGRHVLLVDDVMTTGSTLLSCASAILRDAPGCRISIAALAVSQRELGVKE